MGVANDTLRETLKFIVIRHVTDKSDQVSSVMPRITMTVVEAQSL